MTGAAISQRARVDAITAKIAPAFPKTPEARLMLAVINNAIEDAMLPVSKSKGARTLADKTMAIHYLSGEMRHAEICGVDSQWIREVIHAVTNYQYNPKRKSPKKNRAKAG